MVPGVVARRRRYSAGCKDTTFQQALPRMCPNSHVNTSIIGCLFTVILTLADIWSAIDKNYRSCWLDALLAEVTAPSGKGHIVCRYRDSFSSSGACAEGGVNGTFRCDGVTDP